MTFKIQVVAASMLAVVSIASANAQAPLTEKNVSMKMSQAIIDGTIEQCTKDGYKVSVVIVDFAGLVHASLRGDGTNPHTMEFARKKAYTARTRGQTSLEFMKLTENPANAYLRQIPDVVAVGGAPGLGGLVLLGLFARLVLMLLQLLRNLVLLLLEDLLQFFLVLRGE